MSSILKNFNLGDLSVTVSEALPSYWPSHMPFAAKVWNYYTELNDNQGFVRSDAPYQTRFWIIDEHCGTHFDAPTHFIPHPNSGLPWAGESGTQTGDKVPLENLMGSAVCIDVSDLSNIEVEAGESPWVTVDHVKAWEQVHGPLCAEVVLFRTGWDRFYIKNDQGHYSTNSLITKTGPGWPAPNDETVIYLYEKGIRCLGIDAPSVGAAHDGAPAHYAGLSRGMRYVEMLTNLDKLPSTDFQFLFLPVKVEGSTGGPGRAIAFVNKENQ